MGCQPVDLSLRTFQGFANLDIPRTCFFFLFFSYDWVSRFSAFGGFEGTYPIQPLLEFKILLNTWDFPRKNYYCYF